MTPRHPGKRDRSAHRFRYGLAVALASVAALSPGWTADALPAFRLVGLRGGEITENDVATGRHYLVVWASWSPRCRDILERTEQLAQREGARSRVVLVSFQETREEVERFLGERKVAVPVYLDSEGSFARAFRIATLPGLVVIADGQIRHQGRLPEDFSSLDTLAGRGKPGEQGSFAGAVLSN